MTNLQFDNNYYKRVQQSKIDLYLFVLFYSFLFFICAIYFHLNINNKIKLVKIYFGHLVYISRIQ